MASQDSNNNDLAYADTLWKTVNEHLVNIYEEGELDREATIRGFRRVQTEGARQVSRTDGHYSLDAILAVGYRVRSARGTAFRQWATSMVRRMPTLDWTQRKSVRATLRRNVRRLLAKYGYPPDLAEGATQLVLRQAELSTENCAGYSGTRPDRR
jgi:hypothetical protein